MPSQPSQCPSSPVQFLITTPFTPGRVGRGRGQPELPDQPKLQLQPPPLHPQPDQGVASCLAFRPGLAPLDDQFSRRAVDQVLARFRLLSDQLGEDAAGCSYGPPLPAVVSGIHILHIDAGVNPYRLSGLQTLDRIHPFAQGRQFSSQLIHCPAQVLLRFL